jgi:pimeloyl-ACP methyl ester carboxylesterase
MENVLVAAFLCLLVNTPMRAVEIKPVIYLLSGQGSDHRIFNNLNLDRSHEVFHIKYHVPEEGISLKEYAHELSEQIDISKPFILIGMSLGGMLATEITDFLDPEKVIIISSAKCRKELPGRYKFQSKFPIYKILSSEMAKKGAQLMQPIVEPDRNKEKETFKAMLKDKDPDFLRITIDMILNWKREDYSDKIIHIHGDNDKTIPHRNVKYDYLIENGSHMMTLTRGEEISSLVNKLL